jgi:integrase
MKRSTFNILFYINRSKTGKNGRCPVMGRITVDGKAVQFSTGGDVAPALWSVSGACSTGKSKADRELNRKIEQFRADITFHYNRQIERNACVTSESLKNAIRDANKGLLLEEYGRYTEEVCQSVGITKVKGTYTSCKSYYASLLSFLRDKYGVEDVPLSRLTSAFIEEYEFYLRISKGLLSSTVARHVVALKKVVLRAVNKGVLSRHPFPDYVVEKAEAAPRKWLDKEDLDRIMQTHIKQQKTNRTRNLFIFSVFTGLSYVDLCNLRWEDITTDANGRQWIRQKRTKTGSEACIPLLDIPLAIIEKHKGTGKDGRVFDVDSYNVIAYHIDKIRQTCDLKTHLTFHAARHTWATLICLSNGVPIETLSRTMGHRDISTTQIYAKITNRKIGEDMEQLGKRIAEKYSL